MYIVIYYVIYYHLYFDKEWNTVIDSIGHFNFNKLIFGRIKQNYSYNRYIIEKLRYKFYIHIMQNIIYKYKCFRRKKYVINV